MLVVLPVPSISLSDSRNGQLGSSALLHSIREISLERERVLLCLT
jgi:hypothetical protein